MIRRFCAAGSLRPSHGLLAEFLRCATVTPLLMPALSPTMEKGKVVEWSRKVGDAVAVGESFCRLETDKAVVSFDNQDEDCFIARIIGEVGETIAVGQPVCLVVDKKEDVESDDVKNWVGASAAPPPASTPVEETPVSNTPVASTAAAASRPSGARVAASPLARTTAAKLGVDLQACVGTGGTAGRITQDDVLAAAKKQPSKPAVAATEAPTRAPATAVPAAADYIDLPVSSMRETIARRLTQSKNVDVPHFYIMSEMKAANMLATLKHLNAKGAGEYKVSVNDFLIKAMTRACRLVPACNSQWMGSTIRQFTHVDVSVAVATPTGLITPIIYNADGLGLAEISKKTKMLAAKAQAGSLAPDEYVGGTVTISNLGSMGVSNFTAIVNAPQSMILAVGTTLPKPEMELDAETKEWKMTGKVELVLKCTASFDHRVVDGAVGAEWCKHFKDAVENPLSLLL